MTSLSDKETWIEADNGYLEEDVKEAVKELISRTCCPNKPLNTFEYAREIEEIIKEIFGPALTGDGK